MKEENPGDGDAAKAVELGKVADRGPAIGFHGRDRNNLASTGPGMGDVLPNRRESVAGDGAGVDGPSPEPEGGLGQ
ncbi:MAG TPA: hypothetical protein VHY77_05440, partial [Acidimicrobiales bacterium]|nr:hypothetical protein [Acidimicrobiales bacterium]